MGSYSVYEMHRLCFTNSSGVESSVVILDVLKRDPFWVFKITSVLKHGSCLVVRWEGTRPKQKQKQKSHNCNGSLKAGALMDS